MAVIRAFAEIGRDDVAEVGGKGANLGELTGAGLPVPPGFVVTTDAYRAFVAAAGIEVTDVPARVREAFTAAEVPGELAASIRDAYAELGGGPVAVRSSATAEDLAEASFAGQQDTFLNVRGPDAVVAAVRECWASLWTDRAVAYRGAHAVDESEVALAVVVQEMVDADAAGVLFTADPTTGRRDLAVVGAAWGLGEAVVSGAVTTDDLVVDKPTGAVVSRTTADKAVMTVYADERTEERPVPAAQRTAPVLDDGAAAALVSLGVRIERHYGVPQDVEWARSGGRFRIVQARPITALPPPEAAPPTDWTVPDPDSYWFRASIVEQLPDPLTPLFADLLDGAVSRSLSALMLDALGLDALRPGDITMPTINGYAYYRYSKGVFRRMFAVTPAAIRALATSGEGGMRERWRDVAHPLYAGTVAAWAERDPAALTDAELLDGVVTLLDAGCSYYTAVQTIIPIAVSTETVFTAFYDRAVRRAGDVPALTFLLGFDSAPIRAEKSSYDLARWVADHPAVADAVRAGHDGTGPEWDRFQERVRAHLDRHGHMTYNLDFANPTLADDPAPLLAALRFHLDATGTDPYTRQAASTARREEHTAAVRHRLDPARRAVFDRLLRAAQDAGPLREDALADVGLAWPRMRVLLAELGRRRAADGTLSDPADVYWLRGSEVTGAAHVEAAHVEAGDGGAGGSGVGALDREVADRKAIWRGRRRVTPPQMLPEGAFFGVLDRFMPAVSGQADGPVLKGTGASGGAVTATARVLAGPADFPRMQSGDVLVASITTPAWTSLFTTASAVVTDIGGPLSHSSIVAREYGIPAVLGTGVGTKRIPDGARVRVDGDAGTVTLLDEEDRAQAPVEAAVTRPNPALLGTAAVGAGVLVAALWWRRRRR